MAEHSGKVTMYTIAGELGVSVTAVSRAFDPKSRLKPEKRQLILDTAKQLGYAPNKLASRLSGEATRIGVLIYGFLPVYYEEYIAGIRDAYSEFSDYKVTMDLRVLSVESNSFDEAYAVIDEFIENGMEGVIISGLVGAQHQAQLKRLADAGIAFILLDTDLEDCGRSGVSMNDVDTAGRMAAQLLSAAMRGPGRAVIFAGSATNLNQQGLVRAFCKAAPGFSLETSAVYYTMSNPELAEKTARIMLSANPDVGGIYISTANSVPVIRVLEEMGLTGKISVVASDVFAGLNERIRAGIVFATIYQDPFHQARSAFESLFYHLVDGTPIREYILARPQAVFASNLNLYEK